MTRRLPIVLLVCSLLGSIAITASCQHSTPIQEAADEAAVPQRSANTADSPPDHVYVCPMDRDIRSYSPGSCPRCGMTLVASIPEPAEYRLDLAVQPTPVAGRPVHLKFDVFDPWSGHPVMKFGVVHERLFHAFIVSRDLEFFRHDHPEWKDGSFHDDVTLPKPGMYRILTDFYPEAATPQLLNATVFVAGDEAPPRSLTADSSPKQAENLRVELSVSPAEPIAGSPARLRFTLSPGTGLERLLGAWGHMLIASDDLIDMMHEHPSLADGTPEMQFSLVFPRARMYRLWVQFQRDGIVNTAHFDIRVNSQGGSRS